MNIKSFIIGYAAGNHVAVDILRYEFDRSDDKHDANWLLADISVHAGAWSGRIKRAFFTTAEIAMFREDLEALLKKQKGEARLEPLEPHVVVRLNGDGHGKVEVSGVAFDAPGGVNAIAYNWTEELDDLQDLVRQLKSIEKAFPPR